MKVAIFAGGYGTRLSEETTLRPKPMVNIGGRPILHHIMEIYSRHGLTDFVVLGGYKVEVIKDYFLNYYNRSCDFTIDLSTGAVELLNPVGAPWKVTVLDTGVKTMTGGRLKRAKDFLKDETFCLTYGDGVADIDITALISAHKASGAKATVTAVAPPGRFGVLGFDSKTGRVHTFREKDANDVGLINGGFFVCEPSVIEYVDGDDSVWEQKPLRRLVDRGELNTYHHNGFWQSMDSLRDKEHLQEQYAKGAPWLE